MLDTTLVRTTKQIKEDLLRRVWDGQSRYTPAQMILLIQWVCSRANTLSPDHDAMLFDFDPTQPRSVMMLNTLMALEGSAERYSYTAGKNIIIPEIQTLQ